MTTTIKIVIVGVLLCIAGAVVIDCHVIVTGWTLMFLGIFFIMAGPMLADL